MEPVINDDIWSVFTIEDTRDVILECIRTSRALAELKGMMKSGVAMGVTSDFIVLQEALASSAISGSETDMAEVFKASVTTERDFGTDVNEVIRDSVAIRECVGKAPGTKVLEKICSTIRDKKTQIRKTGHDYTISEGGKKIYSAPLGRNVPALMKQYDDFLAHNVCTDELIKCCMAMLMFEAISPFDDYSGRVGRASLIGMMEHYGLIEKYGLLLSPYICEHRDEYYAILKQAVMSGHSQDYLMFMLKAIREGAFQTMQKLYSISIAYSEVKEEMTDSPLCNDGLLNAIFGGIYCKSSNLIKSGIAERVTAMKYLRSLEEMGILESEKVGREVVFKNVTLYNALVK